MTALSVKVANILALTAEHPRHAEQIDFRVGALHVDRELFREVVRNIRRGTIAVGPWEDAQNANRRQTGLASWANDQDVMWVDPALVSDPALGPNYNANQVTVNQIRRAGVLAHEAVHAYCDIHRMSAYNELTEEAVGYVTQQLVLDVFFERFLDGTTPEQNRVMREASAVVIACGLATRSGRGRDVSRHELQRLRDAIQGYAPYSHLTENGANIHHDGVDVGRRRCRALQAGRE